MVVSATLSPVWINDRRSQRDWRWPKSGNLGGKVEPKPPNRRAKTATNGAICQDVVRARLGVQLRENREAHTFSFFRFICS